MEIQTHVEGGLFTITIMGDLDANGSIILDRVVEQAVAQNHYKIMVNCIQLDYISSAGLGVFISYLKDLTANRGGFVFYGLQDNVRTAFNLLGLEKVMSIVTTEDEAIGVI